MAEVSAAGCACCVIHFVSKTNDDQLLHTKQFELTNIKQRAEQWMKVEPEKQPEKSIAEKALSIISSKNTKSLHSNSDTSADLDQGTAYRHHRLCYVRFTSLSKIHRAQRQKRKQVSWLNINLLGIS